MEFYPSITETILDNALSFAKQHVEISDKDSGIIKHCRKSLYHENETWKKKNSDNCFDVTMGSYDEAKICELVGTPATSTLTNSIPKEKCDLYMDDELILIRMIRNKNRQNQKRGNQNIQRDRF